MSLYFIICVQQESFKSEVMSAFDADDCVFWLLRLKHPGKTNEGLSETSDQVQQKNTWECK